VICLRLKWFDCCRWPDLTTLAISESDLCELKTQRELASAWSSLLPKFLTSNIHVLPSVEHAIKALRTIQSTPSPDNQVQVLVTGSLHLVGGIIEVAGLSEAAL
jgi:folylpolyglutamate synthase